MQRLTKTITLLNGEKRNSVLEVEDKTGYQVCVENDCDSCPIQNAFDRLSDIEDILGNEYNLDKLRRLVEMDKADEIGKYRFYYCESEDEYLIGARLDTMYYARWSGNSFVWCMSRYLPWGQHIVAPQTAWKEHTYPSEPKEIDISVWFRGFLNQRIKAALKKDT